MNPFFLYFIAFSAALALLFTLGELVVKEKSSQAYIQACLFFLAAIFQSHTFYIASGSYVHFPYFYMLHLPFTSLFGSVLFRYFSIFWTEGKNTVKFRIYESLPPFAVVCLLLPFYSLSGAEKIETITNFPTLGVPFLVKLAITIAVCPIFIASIIVFGQLFRYLRWKTVRESAHLRLVLYVIFLGTLASVIGLFTLYYHKRHGLDLVSGIIGIILILVFLLRQRNPEILGEINRIVIEEKKYQITQLKSVDVTDLGLRLTHLMEESKIYRNDEINLGELSAELAVSQHQLSEFLNQHLGKNFFAYINHYRIREAKELCKNAPEKTILSIAYEVGFPSKSTFYDAFKRETGMSPTEYRKSIRPNG
ncbi:AraC family transcriptional regulator [Leptospira ognonensis]|uniref:AraC family transcriptional regulator n=1 Tax=Leptospira ognonensis TaxID=2484945 RepID=A0A4R9K3B2_9LEPT|nr:helix-turn-helix domain-containing protein [Leptospira ognonensis]TGL59364.1 AraC family transcriptional regulator [Leptospira ognonensis]